MCRLSIIVPYDRDEAAFEATLVSVLENRPEHCEVLVTHDGSYCDPFDLGDEVRFVISSAGDTVSLLQAAVRAALGRVVHVLCSGARATEQWTEEPLALFEQSDLACVAPVLRDLSARGRVVAAGWRDVPGGLRKPIAAGAPQVTRGELASVEGAYACAAFWRRSALDAMGDLPLTSVASVVDYAWSMGTRLAGWRCRIAPTSTVTASPSVIRPSGSAWQAGQALQAMRCRLKGQGLVGASLGSLLGVAGAPLSGQAWGEAAGRIAAAAGLATTSHQAAEAIALLDPTLGPQAAQATILKMPHPQPLHRRAA